MKKGLTIAIVTKNRPELLSQCLESLVRQIKKPDVVLVVDNDRDKTAELVCNNFSNRLKIKYVVEKKMGIPLARNKALQVVETRYLGFIDDDCMLEPGWVKEGLKGIVKHRSAFVVGRTKLVNKDSLIARAQFFHYQRWFLTKLDRTSKKISPQNLDTKNVIFDMKALKQPGLRFDQRYSLTTIGGGEDVDMGLQLSKLGYKGFYVERMMLKHREVESLQDLIRKSFWRGQSSYLLAEKWQLKDQIVDLSRVNWYKWLKNFWVKPYDNKRLSKQASLEVKLIHVLTKVYDRVWLEGYVKQMRKANKTKD